MRQELLASKNYREKCQGEGGGAYQAPPPPPPKAIGLRNDTAQTNWIVVLLYTCTLAPCHFQWTFFTLYKWSLWIT